MGKIKRGKIKHLLKLPISKAGYPAVERGNIFTLVALQQFKCLEYYIRKKTQLIVKQQFDRDNKKMIKD